MLAEQNGRALNDVRCSDAHLSNHVWEALYVPWATYRYSCPENLGHGSVDTFTVSVRHGEIIDVAGGV